MDKAEQPTIGQAQYLAMRCDNMPTDCVNFGVVDTLLGKEICRVWDEEDCRMIADLLNAPPIPDRTTSLAAQDGLVEALLPFVDMGHQKGAWGIIQKATGDFEPVTITITKRQMLNLLAALSAIKEQHHD